MRKPRLRAKFLLSLLAISTGLTTATLWAVRAQVERRTRANMRADLTESLHTYQVFQRQREAMLRRAAGLIADLPNVRAMMTTMDPRTIQDASQNVWRLSGADVLILAGRDGRLEALRSAAPDFPRALAMAALPRSLAGGAGARWWWGNGRLYEIWTRPIYFGPASAATLIGYLLLGHAVDASAVREASRIAGAEVAFSCNGALVATTLPPDERAAFAGLTRTQTQRPAAGEEATEVRLRGKRYSMTALPLGGAADAKVTLSLLKSWDRATAFLSALNRILIALGLLSLLLGGVLAYVLAHTITRPLAHLVSGVRALAAGDFAFPLRPGGDDEVGELTAAFAQMRHSLAASQEEQQQLGDRLRQAAKMEAVGRLAGGVAHDFNNLLTVIAGNVDLLLRGDGLGDRQRHQAEQVWNASERAVGLTRQLLAFSHKQVLQPRALDLNAVVGEMGKMLPRLIGEDVEYFFAPGAGLPPVLADPGQVEQVILNLAVNARDAMPRGGRLAIATRAIEPDEAAAGLTPLAAGAHVLLEVSDTGHGMDEATKARIFEPFFTTKEVGRGTGLGLATVYGIVQRSGGAIAVESAPGRGAAFKIYWPRAPQGAAAAAGETNPAQPRGGTETILLVEDEGGVRDLACQFLRAGGYTVVPAKDGREALSVAGAHRGVIHLLLTDLVMPRMGGLELARRMGELRPAMKVLFTTGYSELPSSDEASPPAALILQKPYNLVTLLNKARAALTGMERPKAHAE